MQLGRVDQNATTNLLLIGDEWREESLMFGRPAVIRRVCEGSLEYWRYLCQLFERAHLADRQMVIGIFFLL